MKLDLSDLKGFWFVRGTSLVMNNPFVSFFDFVEGGCLVKELKSCLRLSVVFGRKSLLLMMNLSLDAITTSALGREESSGGAF